MPAATLRLKTYIALLIVATLAPVTIFGIVLGSLDPIKERAAILDQMSTTSKGLSLALDRQLEMSVTGLEALATSRAFLAGDFGAFREQADRYLSTHEGWIAVLNENGEQLLNTVLPPGAPLPRTVNRELLHQVFLANNIYVSDAISGTLLKRLIVVISIHVHAPTNLVLSQMLPLDALTRLLQEQGLPKGWIGVVADRNGIILGRTQTPELIGRPMTLRVHRREGVVKAVSHEGDRVYFAWTTSDLSGWSTGVAAPISLINARSYQRFSFLSAAGLAAVLFAVFFAVLFGRRVIQPLTCLAHGVAEGGTPDNRLLDANTGVVELDTLAVAFRIKFRELMAVGEELRELNQGLEHRVREEVTAREAAQVRAAHAERMQALGQLAGGIAHDINNVLQAVTGSATLIARRPADAERVMRFARMILDAGMRGTSVTQRLLVFARRSDLRAESIDAEQLLIGIHELLSHSLGSAIAVRLGKAPETYRLFADKAQLETVLVNLATNSRDAMPQGGTITLSYFRDNVASISDHAAALLPGSYIAIAVTDTGRGMDQATLARVSEPFFTTKGHGGGTGLGLAMARGFVEQSGGGLHVASVLNQGTTVTIWLPEAPIDKGSMDVVGESRLNRRTASGGDKRVLLVDDDALVRESIALQMEADGYNVVAVSSGLEALASINTGERFDCMVTDLSMPNMDGLALIRQVHQRCPHLPVVLLTGYATDSTGLAMGGAMSGTFSLLRKPILGNELTDRIASLISSHLEA